MTDIQERLEHYEADDRERRGLEAKIKDLDLNMLIISKDKNAPDEEFRAVYLQRCKLLRRYRGTYGQEAELQLRDQLAEAREVYAKQYEAEEQLSKMDAVANAHAYEIMDVKRRILDELYNFPALELLGVLLELQKKHKDDEE